MNRKQNLTEELNRMQNLFSYKKGVVISEQNVDVPSAEQLKALSLGYGPVSKQQATKLLLQGKLGDISSFAKIVDNILARNNGQRNQKTANEIIQQAFPSDNPPPYSEWSQFFGNNPVTARGNASDDFRNPDGSIQVKELPGITVTGRRKPTAKPVTSSTPTKTDSSDSMTNPDGSIQVKELPGITVTGYRKKPTAKPVTSSTLTPPTSATAPTSVNLTQTKQSPEQFYNTLVSGKAIDSLKDSEGYERRRIKFKGPQVSDEQLKMLDDFLKTKGYTRIKQKVKEYGTKYVWENPNF